MFKIILSILVMMSGSLMSFAQEGCQDSYIVKPGDTLSGIAFSYLGGPVWPVDGTLRAVKSCNLQIKNQNLIYPGDNVLIPYRSGYNSNAALPASGLQDVDANTLPDEPENNLNEQPLAIENTPAVGGEVKTYKKHGLAIELSSFHSELAATQTSGAAIGSEADEILSDPSVSGRLAYHYGLTKSLELKFVLGFKNYIYSEDLDLKIVNTQENFSINPGLGLLYKASSRLSIDLDISSFEQGYYFGDGSGNLIFDYDRVIRFELNPEYMLLKKNAFNFGLGLIATYHLEGDEIEAAFGIGYEAFIEAFFDKRMRFHARYYDLDYDFVSSEARNELLELGVSYKWVF